VAEGRPRNRNDTDGGTVLLGTDCISHIEFNELSR
jgi:hypothetical protein